MRGTCPHCASCDNIRMYVCVCVCSPLEISSEWLVVESTPQPEEAEASRFINFDIDEVHTYVRTSPPSVT